VVKRRSSTDFRRLIRALREFRLAAGLRQEDLAKALGRTQYFVSRYESGQRGLDFLEVRDICRALRVSLADLAKQLDGGAK
jgi:transcriptional regulator with XRE-family HTH domain